jgi:hypothetical protein
MHAVILHGGLGNQLFQWSYGHQLALNGKDVSFVFYKRPYILEHTRNSLGDFLPNCPHSSFTEIELPKSRLGRVLLDPLHKRNLLNKAWGEVIDSSSNPFAYSLPDFTRKKIIHFGYFQAFESPMACEEILLKELWQALEKRARTHLEIELEGAEIIHVRQGDTLTKSNMKKVGVLSSDYYSQISSKSRKPRIILTDDVKGAINVLPHVHIDDIYGPSDLDVYQTLGVMARAQTLYTANSTLSWWGGFLAQSRGAKVYIPHPFFRDYSPDPELSFAYPGFQIMAAHYMEVPDQ